MNQMIFKENIELLLYMMQIDLMKILIILITKDFLQPVEKLFQNRIMKKNTIIHKFNTCFDGYLRFKFNYVENHIILGTMVEL